MDKMYTEHNKSRKPISLFECKRNNRAKSALFISNYRLREEILFTFNLVGKHDLVLVLVRTVLVASAVRTGFCEGPMCGGLGPMSRGGPCYPTACTVQNYRVPFNHEREM